MFKGSISAFLYFFPPAVSFHPGEMSSGKWQVTEISRTIHAVGSLQSSRHYHWENCRVFAHLKMWNLKSYTLCHPRRLLLKALFKLMTAVVCGLTRGDFQCKAFRVTINESFPIKEIEFYNTTPILPKSMLKKNDKKRRTAKYIGQNAIIHFKVSLLGRAANGRAEIVKQGKLEYNDHSIQHTLYVPSGRLLNWLPQDISISKEYIWLPATEFFIYAN